MGKKSAVLICFVADYPKLNVVCFVLLPNDKISLVFICFVPADPKLNVICFVLVIKQIKTNAI
jgi:hypothetical protein